MAEGLMLKDMEKHIKENYIGKEVREMRLPEPFPLDWIRIKFYCDGISDDNPLFTDPAYGPKTRWGCLIAPPTIISAVRYPQPHSGCFDKPWKVLNFVGGNELEWVDVFRAGDRYTTSLVLKDVWMKHGGKGDLLFMIAEGGVWNQHGDLIGKQDAMQIQVDMPEEAKAGEPGYMLYAKEEPYKYSQKEIEEITTAYDAETQRGSKTLYWDEVNVGDKLPKIARGPLTLLDQITYRGHGLCMAIAWPGTFKIGYKIGKAQFGEYALRTNPTTNWPYESTEAEHNDITLVRARGLGLPFDYGAQRYEMAGTLITNWMGDDGFLRRMNVQIRKPCNLGDTTWFSGEVVKKYKVTEGEVEYGAVDIRIDGLNQRGEMTTPGTTTAYLPSPGREVTVPIPVKVDVIGSTSIIQ